MNGRAKLVWQVLLLAVGIGVVSGISRGLAPTIPAFAGLLRMLLNPLVLLGILAIFLLLRIQLGNRRQPRA